MTLSSKGAKKRFTPHRLRMPWLLAREPTNFVALSKKDNAVLDGRQLYQGIHRMAQLEPMEGLKTVVAQRQHIVSKGLNIFQQCIHLPYDGRGQRLYRKDWAEGTMEKYVTITSVSYDRDVGSLAESCGSIGNWLYDSSGFGGIAYGYITFHGESTIRPVKIMNAEMPGWEVLEYRKEWEVPYDRVVKPPPSIGYDVAVDPKRYRLKAYPGYDAPNPPDFVEQRLKDMGILPDVAANDAAVPDDTDGSVPHSPQ